MKHITSNFWYLILCLSVILLTTAGCSSSTDPQPQLALTYSGDGNFSITGDTTFTLEGTAQNVSIVINNGAELFPLNLQTNDGLTLITGANGDPNIQAKTYVMGQIPVQAFTGISLSGELYDAKSGTYTITALSENEIKGSIDVALRKVFSFNDDLFIQGTFELQAN